MNPYYNNPDLDMDQLIDLLKRDPNYIDSEYSKKYEFLLEPSKTSTSGARRKVNKRALEHLLKGANFHNNRLLEQLQQSSSKKLDQKTDHNRKKANDETTSRLGGKEKRKRSGLDMIQGILRGERSNRESQIKRTNDNHKESLHLPSEKKQEEPKHEHSNGLTNSHRHEIEYDDERRHRRSRTRSRSPERHSSRSSRYDDSDRKRHKSSYDRESRRRESRSRRHEKHGSKEKYENVEDFGRLQTKVRSSGQSKRHAEDLRDRIHQSVDLSTSRTRRREHSEERERSSRHPSHRHDKKNREKTRDIKDEITKLIKSNDYIESSPLSLFNRVDEPKSVKIAENHNSNKKSEKGVTGFNDFISRSSSKVDRNPSTSATSAKAPIITKGRGVTSSEEVNKRFSEAYDPKKDFTTSKVTEIYGPSLEGAAPFQFSNSSGRKLASMLKDGSRTSDEKYGQSNVSWPEYSKGEREWDVGK